MVQGNGYTNHCPECFYSKHVDVEPGDRASNCGGLMPPVQIYFLHGQWSVIQKCERCGLEKRNKVQAMDNMEKLAALVKNIARKM